jgi:hypothetical protein
MLFDTVILTIANIQTMVFSWVSATRIGFIHLCRVRHWPLGCELFSSMLLSMRFQTLFVHSPSPFLLTWHRLVIEVRNLTLYWSVNSVWDQIPKFCLNWLWRCQDSRDFGNLRHVKEPCDLRVSRNRRPIWPAVSRPILSFPNRCLSCCLTWSAPGDDGRN